MTAIDNTSGHAGYSTYRFLRPFIPARDVKASRDFYSMLGCSLTSVSGNLTLVSFGSEATSFFLQDFYKQDLAENLMLQLWVDDLPEWWRKVERLPLAASFDVPAPRAPTREPWGADVAYLWDPAGVLWHLTAKP